MPLSQGLAAVRPSHASCRLSSLPPNFHCFLDPVSPVSQSTSFPSSGKDASDAARSAMMARWEISMPGSMEGSGHGTSKAFFTADDDGFLEKAKDDGWCGTL